MVRKLGLPLEIKSSKRKIEPYLAKDEYAILEEKIT